MKEWELDYEWLRVRHLVKKTFDRTDLPDLNAILFLMAGPTTSYGARWKPRGWKPRKTYSKNMPFNTSGNLNWKMAD